MGHANEESHNVSLHKVYASSHMFRGRGGASLHKLFRNRPLAHYVTLLGNAQANYIITDDFYSAITNDMDFTGENLTLELHSPKLLYLFEFYICTKKARVTSSPYICLEWLDIQKPKTIRSLLLDKGLKFHFINDSDTWDQDTVHFYDRNPAGRGLDFID